jgi:hypothetical protein
MARYQILRWKDLPAQVRAETDHDEVTVELDPRAMQRIDATAMRLGLQGTDEYLDEWKWSDPEERPGTAQEVAESLKRELEKQLDDGK